MKWLLAVIGFFYGRWLGAVAGYLLGQAIEAWQRQRYLERQRGTPRVEVLQDLITLAMAVARADGEIGRHEVRMIRIFFERRMGFSGAMLDWLRDALKAERAMPGDWRGAAARLGRALAPAERRVALGVLMAVAMADGRLAPAERDLLGAIGELWGVPRVTFDAWQQVDFGQVGGFGERGTHGGAQPATDRRRWALGVLGLSADASEAEVERAYKRLVREHHPDRFAHLGDELMRAAHERFVEIQEAYNVLKRAD